MLRRIRIKNYKNLRDAEIELGPINLLVGPNASGKTALWEVLWRISRIFRGDKYAEVWGDYERVVSDLRSDLPVTFECSIETDGGDISYSLAMGKAMLEEETLIIGGEMFLHAWWDNQGNLVLHVKGLKPIMEANKPWKWVEPHMAGVMMPMSGEEWAKKLRSVADLVGIDHWGLFRFFNILDIGEPEYMRGNLVGDNLSEHGHNVAAVLWEMKDKNLDLYQEIKEIMDELTETKIDVKLSREATTFYFEMLHNKKDGKKDKGFPVYMDNWPDGWKQILLILTALKTAKNLVFIEEPETHLHPGMFYFLEEQIRKTAERGVQVIMSSHNLEFINHFKFDEVILVEDGEFWRPDEERWKKETELLLGEAIMGNLLRKH